MRIHYEHSGAPAVRCQLVAVVALATTAAPACLDRKPAAAATALAGRRLATAAGHGRGGRFLGRRVIVSKVS
jgi:hypothetical protein